MQKRIFRKTGQEISLFGMGGMRLPTDPETGEIIEKEAEKILDYAYNHGVNYFDTAYFYHGGKSEVVLGNVLRKYDRNSYIVTDKIPIWQAETPEDVEKIFETQLKRTGLDYFDFYFCHALDRENFDKILEFNVLDFLTKKKNEGKILHVGFSFHGTPDVLEEILNAYPWELCQLQLNYFDWDFQDAKTQYEICKKHDIQVAVMEPVRGGMLADLGSEANEILKSCSPERSVPSWAIRYAMEKENVLTVLSGMSAISQVEDNIKTASGEISLSAKENEALKIALEKFKESKQIPCTACNYCEGCPVNINIREMFNLVNSFAFSATKSGLKKKYAEVEHKADLCISCGKCKSHCPQSIDIPSEMKKIAEMCAE